MPLKHAPPDNETIVAAFLYPTISSIDRIPTFSSTKELHLKLNANAASVQSNLRDGKNELIYLIASDAVYNSLSEVQFIEPTNPGVIPTYPQNASTCLQLKIGHNFNENRRVFNQYNSIDKALKQLLIYVVDNMFIKALKNLISGYSNISTKNS